MTTVEPQIPVQAQQPENPYLEGNYGPVHEEVTAFDLPVTGELPADLSGRLLRIGPNPVVPADPATYHWFTGTGMVHGVRIRDGRAEWYRNRFVRADDVVAARGGPATPGPRRTMDFAPNTNVIGHAGDTFAIVEAGALPMLLSYELDTLARSDFGGTLGDAFTAHPKTDPVTGELHAISYYWEHERLQYQVVGTDGRVRHRVDVPVPGRPMVHDMGLTERYAILMDLPVTFSLDAAMAGASFPYRWDPAYGARVGLLPREGGAEEIVWCELPGSCYVFHPVNAYDDGERVVMDVARHATMFAEDVLGPSDAVPQLYRWTIDPATRRVSEQLLDERGQEFPRHDERLVARRHRYAYCVAADLLRDGFTGLIKHDLDAGTSEGVDYGAGRMTMEAVFVPRTDAAAEDDGWLMSYVYDATTDRSDVVVLHAQDLAAGPVATVHLPQRVPFGFHGNWVPDA
ncbi:MAG TPA: carotenoid oxygenase family protein [Mycobacteriales bacterium]|jgi:carotenoid cleavage dioxygenase|nr:carotenoid oxygenase family protein [Mycobacteriales bacterium]